MIGENPALGLGTEMLILVTEWFPDLSHWDSFVTAGSLYGRRTDISTISSRDACERDCNADETNY
jgi:hypothetical protein